MEPILSVKDLSVSFNAFAGKVHAVRDVNFDLYKGETLAIRDPGQKRPYRQRHYYVPGPGYGEV